MKDKAIMDYDILHIEDDIITSDTLDLESLELSLFRGIVDNGKIGKELAFKSRGKADRVSLHYDRR